MTKKKVLFVKNLFIAMVYGIFLSTETSEVISQTIIIWIPILIFCEIHLSKEGIFPWLFLRIIVVFIILMIAFYTPGKWEDIETTGPLPISCMTIEELKKFFFSGTGNYSYFHLSINEKRKKDKIVFPKQEMTIREFIKVLEEQTEMDVQIPNTNGSLLTGRVGSIYLKEIEK